MNRRTKVFLTVCLVAFCSSFVIQSAFQFLGAEKSVWGGNPGWQREIASWNLAFASIVILALRRGEAQTALLVAKACVVLFFLLGTNHLFAFFTNPHAVFHWPPLVLNYLGFVFGVRLLFFSREA